MKDKKNRLTTIERDSYYDKKANCGLPIVSHQNLLKRKLLRKL